MTHVNMSSKVFIDIYEADGFYANISIYDTKHTIGPEYDLAVLNTILLDYLHSYRLSVITEEPRVLELEALQNCLLNSQLEEQDFSDFSDFSPGLLSF